MAEHHENNTHGSMGQLMTGFVLAAILTIIPFALVMSEVEMNRTLLIGIVMVLAAVQIVVHLVYFLHVNRHAEQGWTVAGTLLSVIILAIIIVGSLWVMHNMNVNMMPEMDHSAMPAASTEAPAAPAMDHSAMPGMDHSAMPAAPAEAPAAPAMDHSAMPGMDHSSMPGMTTTTQPASN